MKTGFSVVAVGAVSAVIALAIRASAAGAGAGPNDEREAVRGTWVCESAVVDGKPLPDNVARELRLTITAERYKTERADEVLFDSTYRLDPSTDPKQIEMTATEGDAAGKPALGIYAVDGDTLRMCYVLPGRDRPGTFESTPGSKAFLVTWKRTKGAGGAGREVEDSVGAVANCLHHQPVYDVRPRDDGPRAAPPATQLPHQRGYPNHGWRRAPFVRPTQDSLQNLI